MAEDERAVATSSGGEAFERTTDALMKVICIAPSGRSGYASSMGSGRVEPGARAARRARGGQGAACPATPAELPPGEYPVVMEPRAVGSLLELLGDTALNGLAHAEGRGALVDRLGQQVAAPAINLADSPYFTSTLPRAFDAEGTPKRPMPLIQDGVARAVVHDLRSGALAGVGSTGPRARSPAAPPTGRCPPTWCSPAAAPPASTSCARRSSGAST